MIADLDETIRQLLLEELEIRDSEIDIAFDQPKREWSARLSRPTVNFYLYDVRENVQLRQYGFEEQARQNGQATMQRAPLRLDCNYMMTVWANEPSDEHRLLGRIMQVLFRNNPIPDEKLYGRLRNQRFPIQTSLAKHDKLTNSAEVWSSLDNEIRPSISFAVTLSMEPFERYDEPVVRNVQTQMGPDSGAAADAVESAERATFAVGGVIRNTARNGAPFAGVLVAVQGTARRNVTDSFGRYRIRNLPAGSYMLEIRPDRTTLIETSIQVPGTHDQFDIDV